MTRNRVEINGASDDLVEVGGDPRAEFDALRGWTGRILAADGSGIRVAFVFDPYGGNGAWEVRVTQLDEDLPIPADFNIRIRQSTACPYSPALIVEAPEGTELTADGSLL